MDIGETIVVNEDIFSASLTRRNADDYFLCFTDDTGDEFLPAIAFWAIEDQVVDVDGQAVPVHLEGETLPDRLRQIEQCYSGLAEIDDHNKHQGDDCCIDWSSYYGIIGALMDRVIKQVENGQEPIC